MDPEIKAARVFAVAVLDEYSFPISVITEVIQVSESWVQRHRERLVRRPVGAPQPGDISAARSLVLVRMLQEEFRVVTITEVLGLSKNAIYRFADQVNRDTEKYPPWYRRLIAANLTGKQTPRALRSWYSSRNARARRAKGTGPRG